MKTADRGAGRREEEGKEEESEEEEEEESLSEAMETADRGA